MTSVHLLTVAHIGAAIVFVGTVTAAASRFPRAALSAGEASVARELHRVTVAYGSSALVVPALGLALAQQTGQVGSTWVQVSLALVAAAGALLAGIVVPHQRRVLAVVEGGGSVVAGDLGPLRAATGGVSLLWTATLVLMVVKPW